MLLQTQDLRALVDAADARGWLVHIHALGDRAVVDRDVLEVDVESFKKTQVLAAYFAGRKVCGAQ